MQNEPTKKNIFQDVVPPRKSIRNIEFLSRKKKNQTDQVDETLLSQQNPKKIFVAPVVSKAFSEQEKVPPKKPEEVSYKYEYSEPAKTSKKWIYVATGIFIVALLFGISAFFKSAKITITPKHQTINLNANFTAKKNQTDNSLSFQIVTVNSDVQKTVPATGEQKVDKKATGKIIIFNNYSVTPQKLIATTRFQTPEGLIFRLISPTTVPGKQIKNNQSIPGSVEVAVEADASGENYNIGLKDFVLPALKGDPRYSKIYARSKTVMTGGFSGMQKIVSDDIASSTNSELEKNLKDKLQTSIVSQIPDNFALYQEGLTISYSPVSQISSSDDNVILQKKGTAYAVILDKGSLSRAIVSNILPDNTNDVINVTNMDKLKFSYPDGQTFDPTGNSTVLNFNLSGNVNFVWAFDASKLKSDLLGLSKSQAREIISKYNSISEMWLETSPFWNQTIPKDANKVTLINTLAK